MSADSWARRDARRIHARAMRIGFSGLATRAEVEYLRRMTLFVLASPGDLPTGWASDLGDLLPLLAALDARLEEEEAAA